MYSSVTYDQKYMFSIIGAQMLLLFLTGLFTYLKYAYNSQTMSIIAGGLYFMTLVILYVVMISGFGTINKIKEETMNENYKKDPNYKGFLGVSIQAAILLAGGIIYLLVLYIRSNFVNTLNYEKLY